MKAMWVCRSLASSWTAVSHPTTQAPSLPTHACAYRWPMYQASKPLSRSMFPCCAFRPHRVSAPTPPGLCCDAEHQVKQIHTRRPHSAWGHFHLHLTLPRLLSDRHTRDSHCALLSLRHTHARAPWADMLGIQQGSTAAPWSVPWGSAAALTAATHATPCRRPPPNPACPHSRFP